LPNRGKIWRRHCGTTSRRKKKKISVRIENRETHFGISPTQGGTGSDSQRVVVRLKKEKERKRVRWTKFGAGGNPGINRKKGQASPELQVR